MGYLNPLLSLPAVREMSFLASARRSSLVATLHELRSEADSRAHIAWANRHVYAAEFWRVVATYARHFAHAMTTPDLVRSRACRRQPPLAVDHAEPPGSGIFELLGLPQVVELLAMPVADRVVLADAFEDLSDHAYEKAVVAWRRRKAPMCRYFMDVRTCARCLAIAFKRRPSALAPRSCGRRQEEGYRIAAAEIQPMPSLFGERCTGSLFGSTV